MQNLRLEFPVCGHSMTVNRDEGETIPRTTHQRQAIICKACSKEARKASDGRTTTVLRFWRFA